MRPYAARSLALSFLRRSVGRRNLVRLGRYLTRGGQLDVRNDPATNGEAKIQEQMIRHLKSNGPLVIFDVGAHRGTWTQGAAERAAEAGRELQVHAFEPDPETFALLTETLGRDGSNGMSIRLNECGASQKTGRLRFYRHGGAVGINGFHPSPQRVPTEAIDVETVRLDAYAREQGIDLIHFMKIDAEGHDFDVMLGAEGLLKSGSVDLVQFEYNARWIPNRRFLRDVFEALPPWGYRVGKITPFGVEAYDGWDPDLETFIEGNYLAFREEHASWLRLIEWWKKG